MKQSGSITAAELDVADTLDQNTDSVFSDQTDSNPRRSNSCQPGMRTGKTGHGIQPVHIREAMRRLNIASYPLLPLAVSDTSQHM